MNIKLDRIKKILEKRTCIVHLAVFFLFIFIAFIANRFPHGSVVGVGDFYQMIDPKNHYDRNLYLWLNQSGQGRFNTLFVAFPFYAVLALANSIGFSSSTIASLIMFLFLYGSFLSFYFSIKFIFPKLDNNLRLAGGLLYSLNNFTITIFAYSWGFSHQFLIYIFIPLLMGSFCKILFENNSLNNYAIFSLVLIASLMGFNNVAFFLVIILLQLTILVTALVIGKVRSGKGLYCKIGSIILIYFLSSFVYFLFPLFLSMREEISQISNTSVWGVGGLRERIIATSSTFLNSLFLAMDGTRFPFKVSKIAGLLSFTYFVSILVLVYFLSTKLKLLIKNAKSEIETSLLFLIVFLSLIVLSVRAYSIFTTFNLGLYQLPIFNTFRSPDKIFVLIPYVYVVLLIGLFSISKLKNRIIYLLFAILLAIPYPFYNGKIVRLLQNPGLDNDYQFVNNIPSEYYDAQKEINKDYKSTSVISLPFSVVNSLGWSNYYKWHYVGADPLHLLFNRNYISANDYDHPLKETDLSFREYEMSGVEDEEKFLSLIQNFAGQYIIFHKDIEPKWIDQSVLTQKTLADLVAEGKITKKQDNGFFSLYELKDQYVKPVIISSSGNLTFKKINPTKYQISITNISKNTPVTLRFDQSYNTQWRLYSESVFTCTPSTNYADGTKECDDSKNNFIQKNDFQYLWKKSLFEATHKMNGTYANSWTIDESDAGAAVTQNLDGTYNINVVLYFKPQSYQDYGIIINILVVLAAIFCLTIGKRKRRNYE